MLNSSSISSIFCENKLLKRWNGYQPQTYVLLLQTYVPECYTHHGVCKAKGIRLHWSAVTGRASAVETCSKAADSMTEFQSRVEKAIQPLNQSLTFHLSSSSHNAKLVCVCWHGCKSRTEVWERGYVPDLLKTQAIIKSISMCLVITPTIQGTSKQLIQNS